MQDSLAGEVLPAFGREPTLEEPDVESDRREVEITLGGFVSTTLFYQDQYLFPDNGQLALFVPNTPKTDSAYYGGDLRNTRIFLDLEGPTVFDDDWETYGGVEVDFFGGFRGCGSGCDPLAFTAPRLRLYHAYVGVSRGGTHVRLGQLNSLLFGYMPESVSHIAFPVGHGTAGFIGYHYPGLFFSQGFPLGEDVTGAFHAAIMQGAWANMLPRFLETIATPWAVSPQFEGRIEINSRHDHATSWPEHGTSAPEHGTLWSERRTGWRERGDNWRAGGTSWSLFLAGHLDRKDLGAIPYNLSDEVLTGWAAEAGARVRIDRFTLKGGLYRGHAVAQQFAQILQFGDIDGGGGWGQLGLDLTRSWSFWTFFGLSDQDGEGVTRPEHWMVVPMVRYRSGPFELGLEWLHLETDWYVLEPAGWEQVDRHGNQVALSTLLHF